MRKGKRFDDIEEEYLYGDGISESDGNRMKNDGYSDDDEDDSAESSTSFSFDRYEKNRISEMESTDDMDSDDEGGKGKDDTEIDPTRFGLKPCKPKNIYCDNKELIEEIRKYQNDGVATEKLGELIIKIALHMTTMVRFWRYSHGIKEELAQNAIYRMLLSVPKFNLENDKSNAFGYLSMISYREMLHTLKKHFKQNKVRDVLADAYLTKLSENPNDERIGMLRQTLQRSEEYNAFMKSKNASEKEVDMFALSRPEQERRYKESIKRKRAKTTK